MRVLLIKTSSMGDVIHAFPAISDAISHLPDLELDWCVEQGYVDIAKLHPAVRQVYPISLRSWRKNLLSLASFALIKQQINNFAKQKYDLIIDAQGLIKSGCLSVMASGIRHGYSYSSAREGAASFFYQQCHDVPRQLHAIERIRLLFAQTLNYRLPDNFTYGIKSPAFTAIAINAQKTLHIPDQAYAIILTATSQAKKYWSYENWLKLLSLLNRAGINCLLPSGNQSEQEFCQKLVSAANANKLQQDCPSYNFALPALSLHDLAGIIAGGVCCFGVDTGLTHLATALELPTIAVFTGSNSSLTGVYGKIAHNIGDTSQAVSFEDLEIFLHQNKIF